MPVFPSAFLNRDGKSFVSILTENMKNVTNVFVFYPLHYNSIKVTVHFDDV